jgi:hypothetical protein
MGAIANLLILVVCLDLKSQLAPIHLEQFGAHRQGDGQHAVRLA